ncbi:uncharacterized protein LOC117320126 [Pecten maximus]|uniref:uncharacterized protein LOC117320126 n=1 Tax=Pecten maximus TaxID=6579 RepID=UPI0014585153|nr:uncharacterized protein LOC117320126 [Pecten maximus]
MATSKMTKFKVGDEVRIDNKGKGHIKKLLENDEYTVQIEGIDFEFDCTADRLVLEVEVGSGVVKQTTDQVTTGAGQRHIRIDNSDIDDFVNKQANKNTLSKTFYDLKLLRQFLSLENENREIYQIPPQELCPLLCKFFIGIRKQDGSNYEPSSLRGFMSSFDRQLRRYDYGYSVVSSVEFGKVREVLTAKQRELKKEGKGNKPMKAQPISDEEIETLWEQGQLGCSNPDSVINTLWFFSTVHFGLRGSDEHRSMYWGDVNLCRDVSGEEYLEFDERQTKTRQGTNPRDVRAVNPKCGVIPRT